MWSIVRLISYDTFIKVCVHSTEHPPEHTIDDGSMCFVIHTQMGLSVGISKLLQLSVCMFLCVGACVAIAHSPTVLCVAQFMLLIEFIAD